MAEKWEYHFKKTGKNKRLPPKPVGILKGEMDKKGASFTIKFIDLIKDEPPKDEPNKSETALPE